MILFSIVSELFLELKFKKEKFILVYSKNWQESYFRLISLNPLKMFFTEKVKFCVRELENDVDVYNEPFRWWIISEAVMRLRLRTGWHRLAVSKSSAWAGRQDWQLEDNWRHCWWWMHCCWWCWLMQCHAALRTTNIAHWRLLWTIEDTKRCVG